MLNNDRNKIVQLMGLMYLYLWYFKTCPLLGVQVYLKDHTMQTFHSLLPKWSFISNPLNDNNLCLRNNGL